MKRSLLVSFVIGGVLVFFQNCGAPVDFSTSGSDLSAKSSSELIPMELNNTEQDLTNASTNLENGEASGRIVQDNSPGQSDDKKDKKNPPADVASNDSDDTESESGDLVACILVDHGKSLKLGLIESDLGGVNSVARSVCISRKGCLEKVSAKFEVQGAYDRGYCKHNPNVVRLSDAELEDLLK